MIQFIILIAVIIVVVMDKEARRLYKIQYPKTGGYNSEAHWKFVRIRLTQVVILVLALVVIPALLHNP